MWRKTLWILGIILISGVAVVVLSMNGILPTRLLPAIPLVRDLVLHQGTGATLVDPVAKPRVKVPSTATDLPQKAFNLMSSGQYLEAAETYVQILKTDPNNAELWVKLAEAYLAGGDFEKARSSVNQALKIEAKVEYQVVKARIMVGQGKYFAADEYLRSLPSSEPAVAYLLSVVNGLLGEQAKAQEYANQAAAGSGELAGRAQRLVAAYNEYASFSGAQPPHLYALLSRAHLQNTEYYAAVELAKKAIKMRKDYRDAWILLGYGYFSLAKYDFALEALQNAYELDPTDASTTYLLGIIHQLMKNYSEAASFLSLSLNNGYHDAVNIHQHLADIYLADAKYDRAIDEYMELIGDQSKVNDYVKPIWIAIDILKDGDRAMKLAEKAKTQFPNDALSYNLVGWAQFSAGLYAEAEQNLKQALAIDPHLAAAAFNLGKLYEAQGEIPAAVIQYQAAADWGKGSSIGDLAAERYTQLSAQ